MKAEVWLNIDKIFQGAVELAPARRAAYLDSACAGNDILRREVESLLTADSFEWDLIDKPAIESGSMLLADEEPRLHAGQDVGHYEILELVGKGGMGEVYLALDRTLGRKVALKLLPVDHTGDHLRVERFQQEARVASALNHPNILTIHEFGDVADQQFIATEFVDGETLRSRIARGPLALREAVHIVVQIAEALAAAHRAGIIHRDIKPENIMLRPDGYVKVLDFGLAELAELLQPDALPQGASQRYASSHLLMGTLRYMSPEQANGLSLDARSDIFSLGVVLYEAVTGHRPFEKTSPSDLLTSIREDEPAPLSDHMNGVPQKFAVQVGRMLTKNRDDRYQDAEELVRDLKLLREQLATDASQPATAVPNAAVRRTGRFVPLIVLLFLVGLVLAIGFASYKFIQRRSAGLNSSGQWSKKAPISSPRGQAEPVVLNGVLYVSGGWNICTPVADLDAYDPNADTWTHRAPMLTARGAHGVGVLNGKLYAVGGSVDCDRRTTSVEAYDPASDSWSGRASLPGARADHVVAVANGKLYAIGGMSVGRQALASTLEYDPATDKWTERAPMPTPRHSAAAAVVDGIIYVFGGNNGWPQRLATVEAYDPATDTWTPKHSMIAHRVNFAASELNGVIYAFGGSGSEVQIESYDPKTDTWTAIGQMPAQRTKFGSASFAKAIYLVGGSDGVNSLSDVSVFTPQANAGAMSTCRKLKTVDRAPMPSASMNMAVGEINGKIYLAGGYDDSGSIDRAFVYDPSSDTWAQRAPMPVSRELRATNNAFIDGKLYVIGGNARGQCTSANQAYDTASDTWSDKTSMPTPRCHAAVVAMNGLIYALGGSNTSGTQKYDLVEIYDPVTDAWKTGAPMPTARQDISAVSLNGILYAIGGWNPSKTPGGDLAVMEAYDPATNSWTTKSPMPTARSVAAVGTMNGSIFVIGGQNDGNALTTVESYDPADDRWTTLTDMTGPRTFISAVTVNDGIYLFGGGPSANTRGYLSVNQKIYLENCSD